ncbi:heterogeneous nuclear ribonucleoproteins A2/B1-like [Contarinia nasturtii]|uniref:heterogeneous nuclear ribonucleoproteins A2/B1-like n=1 Tax=Contarinia nasturtii TaxID=265458 RepID=UPI0012D45238|nr:heterogeneous nuclear ribonucleoproteins A2/B1-like [Contarinia nasturtii]
MCFDCCDDTMNNNISTSTTAWDSSNPQPGIGSNVVSSQPGFIGAGMVSSQVVTDSGYPGNPSFGGGISSSQVVTDSGYPSNPSFGGGISSTPSYGGGFGGMVETTPSYGTDGGMGSHQYTTDSSNNLGQYSNEMSSSSYNTNSY